MNILGLQPGKSEDIREIDGKWAEIQLLPDLATGEVLNIGVCFKKKGDQDFLFKLAPNLNPLGCLFGNSSLEQFRFLLEAANEHFSMYGDQVPLSPHIRIGNYRPASGISEKEILDSQFQRMVTIARSMHPQAKQDKTTKESTSSTATKGVQQRVKTSLRKRNAEIVEKVWMDEPFPVVDRQMNIDETLNFQIWSPNDLFKRPKSACIGSAWYASEEHREFFLANSYRSISIAKSIERTKNSRMAVFLLKPNENSDFTRSMLRQIDLSVDKWAVPLSKKLGAEVVTSSDMIELSKAVLDFVS